MCKELAGVVVPIPTLPPVGCIKTILPLADTFDVPLSVNVDVVPTPPYTIGVVILLRKIGLSNDIEFVNVEYAIFIFFLYYYLFFKTLNVPKNMYLHYCQ